MSAHLLKSLWPSFSRNARALLFPKMGRVKALLHSKRLKPVFFAVSLDTCIPAFWAAEMAGALCRPAYRKMFLGSSTNPPGEYTHQNPPLPTARLLSLARLAL